MGFKTPSVEDIFVYCKLIPHIQTYVRYNYVNNSVRLTVAKEAGGSFRSVDTISISPTVTFVTYPVRRRKKKENDWGSYKKGSPVEWIFGQNNFHFLILSI